MMMSRPTAPQPGDLAGLMALAQREHSAGRLPAAAAAYRQILALHPELADVQSSLGDVLVALRQFDQAAAAYLSAVTLKPGLFEAHNNLGNIRRMQGQFDQAVTHYRQAIAARSDFAEAYNNLGYALRDLQRHDEAATCFEQAIALRPDFAGAYNNLGNIFWEQDKPELAVTRYRQAVALQPGFAQANYSLGRVYQQLGQLDLALAAYDQALAVEPDFAEVHYDRIHLKTFRAGDADLALLERLAADGGRLPPNRMAYIHFALAKALEDIGEYGRGFGQLLKGNALKHREIHYDEASELGQLREIAQTFSAELFERFAGCGDPSAVPIFILGMPRSGSTLVEQILASHPQVQGAGELKNLHRLMNLVGDASGRSVPYPQYVPLLAPGAFRQLGQAYLTSLPALAAGELHITDKRPVNFLYAGLIRLILPNARIIHTVRDPMDTCVSCFSRPLAGFLFTFDLGELGRYYCGYQTLMEHWRSVLPAETMLDVSYERVVDNLAEEARRLLDFCGLPWDDRCLSFHKSSRTVKTASNAQVRQPIYRSSLERARAYQGHLEPLLAELAKCSRPPIPGGTARPES